LLNSEEICLDLADHVRQVRPGEANARSRHTIPVDVGRHMLVVRE
jgi:hypothetical protein